MLRLKSLVPKHLKVPLVGRARSDNDISEEKLPAAICGDGEKTRAS